MTQPTPAATITPRAGLSNRTGSPQRPRLLSGERASRQSQVLGYGILLPTWGVAMGWAFMPGTNYALARTRDDAYFEAPESIPSRSAFPRLTWVDMALVALFMVGIYTNFTVQVSAKVPFPSAPAGVAGLILLWRRRDQITPHALACLIGVLALYMASIFCAPNPNLLQRRTTGLIQLTYSLIIGYALFLTVTRTNRRQFAGLFLSFSLVILAGCLLEAYAGLRPVSDAVRNVLYSQGVYENDLRDTLLYGRARPKFFASEPASVTFCYTLFTFLWMVVSPWRFKLVAYVGLLGLGLFAMPGPTLLLMLLLVLPYMLFLASRRQGRLDVGRFLLVACLAAFSVCALGVLAETAFPVRFEQAMSGNDPSFFYRVRGPAIAGVDVMKRHPFAGAGLSGEFFIEAEVTNAYMRSSGYSGSWANVSSATELVVNYFWLHWIYFGIVWGVVLVVAVTVWLRVLGVPSPAFCWMVWAILGQASGAYVGPTCWAVLFLAGAAAVLHQRPDAAADTRPIDPWKVVPLSNQLHARHRLKQWRRMTAITQQGPGRGSRDTCVVRATKAVHSRWLGP